MNISKGNLLRYSIISVLSVLIILMLSSFVFRMIISPRVDSSLEDYVVPRTVEEVIQVNVLNGCGKSGLAAKARNFLRSRGFDVVEIGNARKEYDKSLVIDRVGDELSSKKVAYAIGVEDSLVTSKIDSSLYLRSTIIIGMDFASLKPYK